MDDRHEDISIQRWGIVKILKKPIMPEIRFMAGGGSESWE